MENRVFVKTLTLIILSQKALKSIKKSQIDPDYISKRKGGFYKSGQLLIVILITKILDLPLFFFPIRFFRPHLMKKVGK